MPLNFNIQRYFFLPRLRGNSSADTTDAHRFSTFKKSRMRNKKRKQKKKGSLTRTSVDRSSSTTDTLSVGEDQIDNEDFAVVGDNHHHDDLDECDEDYHDHGEEGEADDDDDEEEEEEVIPLEQMLNQGVEEDYLVTSMFNDISSNLSLSDSFRGTPSRSSSTKYNADNTQAKERMALLMTLKCIFLPLFSQLHNELQVLGQQQHHYHHHQQQHQKISSVYEHIIQSIEKHGDLCSSLIRSICIAFDISPEHPTFQTMWKQLAIQGGNIDYALASLQERLMTIERHPYYSMHNFTDSKHYEKWKKDEVNHVSDLLGRVQKIRECTFEAHIFIQISTVKMLLDSNCTKKTHLIYNLNDKKSKCLKFESIDDDSGLAVFSSNEKEIYYFKSHDPTFALKFVFYSKGYFSNTKIGIVEMQFDDMLKKFDDPTPRRWGTCSFSNNLSVLNPTCTSNIAGELQVEICIDYQHYPLHNPMDVDYPEVPPNYHELFEIIVKKIVNSHHVERNESGEVINSAELLSFEETWIMEELGKTYGITESYKRLILLNSLCSRLDLLIPFSHILQSNIEYINSNRIMNYSIGTKFEELMLNEIFKKLTVKIHNILCDFKRFFPQNKPKGALSTYVSIYHSLKEKYESLSSKQVHDLLKGIIKEATIRDYEMLILEEIENSSNTIELDDEFSFKQDSKNVNRCLNAHILTAICKSLQTRLDHVYNYSSVFQSLNIDYEKISLETYYYHFREDYNQVMGGKQSTYSPSEILDLCSSVKSMNNLILEIYEKKCITFPLIQIDELALNNIPRFLSEIEQKLFSYQREAIALDKFIPLKGTLHSTSIIDLFTAINQTMDYLLMCEFSTKKILKSFCMIICRVTRQYVKVMKERCVAEIPDDIPNHIQATKHKNRSSILLPFNAFTNIKQLFHVGSHQSNAIPSASKENVNIEEKSIIPTFMVKLNNIEAARQQLNSIVENIEKKKNTFFDEDDIDDEDNMSDDELNEDINFTDDDYKKNGEMTKSVFHSKKNQLRRQSKKEQKPTAQDEYSDEIRNSFMFINKNIDELSDIMAEQFKPFFMNTFQKISNLAKNDIPIKAIEEIDEKQIVSKYQEMADEIFKEDLLQKILTPNITSLSNHLYYDLFKKALLSFFLVTVHTIEDYLLPPELTESHYIGKRQNINLGKLLNIAQVYLLKNMLTPIFIFFEGEGKGISGDLLKKHSKIVASIIKLYATKTPKLIRWFHKNFNNNQQFHQQVPFIQRHHVILIIASRSTFDKEAAEFYNQYKSSMIPITKNPTSSSTASPQTTNTDDVINSYKAYDHAVNQVILYLYTHQLLIEKVAAGKSKRRTIRNGHLITLPLKSIQSIRSEDRLVQKDIILEGNNKDTKFMYVFTFFKTKKRDAFLTELRQVTSNVNPSIQISTSPNVMRRFTIALPSANIGHLNAKEDINTLSDPSQNAEDVKNRLLKKFKIEKSQFLIDRFKCMNVVDGFLYIFSECCCFESLLHSKHDILIPFSSIQKIQKQGKADIYVALSNTIHDIIFKRFVTRQSAYDVLSSSLENFKQNQDKSSSLTTTTTTTTITASDSATMTNPSVTNPTKHSSLKQKLQAIVNDNLDEKDTKRKKSIESVNGDSGVNGGVNGSVGDDGDDGSDWNGGEKEGGIAQVRERSKSSSTTALHQHEEMKQKFISSFGLNKKEVLHKVVSCYHGLTQGKLFIGSSVIGFIPNSSNIQKAKKNQIQIQVSSVVKAKKRIYRPLMGTVLGIKTKEKQKFDFVLHDFKDTLALIVSLIK